MNKKIKVLVLSTDYPDLCGNVTLMYVHVRNIQYAANGINVTVINFKAKKGYEIDGIKVITLDDYRKMNDNYDLLISHAPNLRNHFSFLYKYHERFHKIIFFFHGHEVLKINEAYSKPYFYVKTNKLNNLMQDCYDIIKLTVWNRFFTKWAYKSYFVFVSKWMLEEFLKWTKVNFSEIENNHMITYNCIGKHFEQFVFDSKSRKEYDFITIRSNLDGSKYSIDIVNQLAKNNPEYKFLVIGKGEFFQHYEKAENIDWLNKTMNHKEIINMISISKCALMPTRTDAQGLMMCELASTGMPLITSDLPVCHEVFDSFRNIAFIPNNPGDVCLKLEFNKLLSEQPYKINQKYYNKNTSQREIDLIYKWGVKQ